MTPKVMARPTAASSNTEPRLRPWKTLPTPFQNASRLSMSTSALAAAARTASDVLELAMAPNSERTSGTANADRVAMAARRSASILDLSRATAARAMISRSFTLSSVSRAMACSRTGSAERARDLNTASAAARRLAGSLLSRVRPPSTPRKSLRRRLLMRIFLILDFLVWPISLLVSGSVST